MSLVPLPGVVNADTYTPDRLLTGNGQVITDTMTLIAGQSLTRGALVGKITASGKLTLCLSASADGSQTPYAILVDDCNATSADTLCGVYLAGEFNSRSMTFGTGTTAVTAKDPLRAVGIFLKSALSATFV